MNDIPQFYRKNSTRLITVPVLTLLFLLVVWNMDVSIEHLRVSERAARLWLWIGFKPE